MHDFIGAEGAFNGPLDDVPNSSLEVGFRFDFVIILDVAPEI